MPLDGHPCSEPRHFIHQLMTNRMKLYWSSFEKGCFKVQKLTFAPQTVTGKVKFGKSGAVDELETFFSLRLIDCAVHTRLDGAHAVGLYPFTWIYCFLLSDSGIVRLYSVQVIKEGSTVCFIHTHLTSQLPVKLWCPPPELDVDWIQIYGVAWWTLAGLSAVKDTISVYFSVRSRHEDRFYCALKLCVFSGHVFTQAVFSCLPCSHIKTPILLSWLVMHWIQICNILFSLALASSSASE